MRRDFMLPEQDIDFLEASGHRWETIRDPSGNWVVIYDYPVPSGYNITRVNAALKIDAGYPVAQIDMVYFYPALAKLRGSPIKALATQTIQGTSWQRWSRHRTGENPWRPEIDDVSTHLQLVSFWMERELNK
jgi:hypothetical protein